MSTESDLYDTLKTLVASNRAYTDVAAPNTPRPYITYQRIGGQAFNYVEGGAVGLSVPRYQVNVWHDTRLAADTLAKQVETALRNHATLLTHVESLPISLHDDRTGAYGTAQDFSFASN